MAKWLLLLLCFGAHAETWNAAADFGMANPSGPWSYGYTVGNGPFTPFAYSFTSPPAAKCDGLAPYLPDMPFWTEMGGIWIYPHVGKPHKGDFWNCGSWQSPQDGWLHFEPGLPPYTNGHRAALQFTLPRAMCIKVLAQAELSDSLADEVIARLHVNGNEVSTKTLEGKAAHANFSLERCMGAVESFMLSIDGGPTFPHNSTEVRVSVVEIL